MIKYIFTKSEIKTMFYLTGHGNYKCSLFDVNTLEQAEFYDAEEGLIAKNVINRINNSDIVVDKMFVAIIDVIVKAEYECDIPHVMAAVGSIVIVLEEDSRNNEIIKMIPYKNIEEAVEDYGTDLLMPC